MTSNDVFSLLVVVGLAVGGVAYAVWELRKLGEGGMEVPCDSELLPEEPIVVREKRSSLAMKSIPLLIILTIAVAFTLMAGASVATGFLAGAVSSTVLLLVTAWHVRGIIAPRAVVIIDRDGVDFVRARVGLVLWDCIDGIRIVASEDDTDYLVVDVVDVEVLLDGLHGWRAGLARLRLAVAPMPALGVRLSDTVPDAEGLHAVMAAFQPEIE